MQDQYSEFLKSKEFNHIQAGFNVPDEWLSPYLKAHQSVIVPWALRRGRAGIFADTGLGKTIMQLNIMQAVETQTEKPCLIFAPLGVTGQTVKEADKFGFDTVTYVRSQDEIGSRGVYITNYEMLDHFDFSTLGGLALDEASILKNETGKTRKKFVEAAQDVPYRYTFSATPSPNDTTELGNQSEFLGIMRMQEMLAMFFTHDGFNQKEWVLKGHGKTKFWEWLATWSVVIRKPSDLGFGDEGYDLPPLNIVTHTVEVAKAKDGQLFAHDAETLSERRVAKKESMDQRIKIAADLVNSNNDKWLIWCHLNDEQDRLEKEIATHGDCLSVRGSDKPEKKADHLIKFAGDNPLSLISKPSIAGMGMNYQTSHNMVFVGINDSYEQLYQAIRRQYRFGQSEQVNVHLIMTDAEGNVWRNIQKKQAQHDRLSDEMVVHMKAMMEKEIFGSEKTTTPYDPQVPMELPTWLQ